MHIEAIALDKSTVESDALFHKAIVLAAKNSVLLSVYESISDLLYSLKLDLVKVDKEKSLYFHKKIYTAIKNKDVEEAKLAMKEHLLDVTSRFEEMYNYNL